jgi:dGTPase
MATPKERIEYLRAKAISRLIDQTVAAFIVHEAAIVNGDFEGELLACIPHAQALALLRQRAAEQVYVAPSVIEVGAAGFHVLAALLETFVTAVDAVAAYRSAASPRQQMLLRLVPEQFIGTGHEPMANPYQRLLGITDFISGMTDSYALELYRKLHGIAVAGI